MPKMLENNEEKLIAFLAALCLFLSAIEYGIPKPLPFMRLGLANIPILISLFLLKPKEIVFLAFLKVLGQGFITGTMFSYIFIFSLLGTFASSSAMICIHRIGKTHVSPIGISIIGSIANAVIQIVLSELMLFGHVTLYIAPILLINACITGFALGICTSLFLQKSQWFLQRMQNDKNEVTIHDDIL